MKKIELDTESLIPPFEKNWNWREKKNYKKEFTYLFLNYYFPYLLEKMSKYGVPTKDITLLDIGCGWGPMAIPLLINSLSQNIESADIKYLGIDIRRDAIDWLEQAYTRFPFVKFKLHEASNKVDYIEAQSKGYESLAESNGHEGRFSIDPAFSYSIQWSSSLFTHLTKNACLEALQSIKTSARKSAIQINTWLIIDDQSSYCMASGIADRKLDVDCGSFLSYSKENPLVCTAYKIEELNNLYTQSGLEILDIDRGSWRGPFNANSARHYQDIVISRSA